MCDQDFLRKFARDTDAGRLHTWFNREVPRLLRSLKLLDAEGLYIGDASYIFVPDNEHYEDSAVLLFDEHNHPVDSKKVDLRDKRYQWRRCYKMVTLIHVNRSLDLFLTVAAKVVPGNQHECPILYSLVDGFVKAVERGPMKLLMIDRGLIDGPNIGRLKTDHRIDTVVPLKKNMDAYKDAIGLTRRKDFPWETYQLPYATERGQKDRPKHPTIVKREATRQKTLAKKKGLPPPQPVAQPQILLGIARGVSSWTDCPVPLTLEGQELKAHLINREIDKDGNVDDWVLATTSATMTASGTRENYKLRTAIEERHRQYKCFWDLAHMTSCQFSMVVSQVLWVLLAYTLLQGHIFLRHRQAMNPRTRGRLLQILNPALEVVAVYYQQRVCRRKSWKRIFMSLGEFGTILLELEEEPRAKLKPKMKQIQRDIYHLLQNARPP